MLKKWLSGEKIIEKRQYDRASYDAKRADSEIKYCPNCNRCYEIDTQKSKMRSNRIIGKKVYLYYEDFPTYGKQIKVCKQCK